MFLIFLLLAAVIGCKENRLQPKAGHIIFIGVDGVSTPAFKDPVLLARMPNVKMMMEKGAFTLTKRSVMPSSSAINWATIFNGLPTEQHGYGQWNSSKPEIPAVLDNGRGMPPTLYTLLREQRPEAEMGCVYNWNGIGPLLDTVVINYHLYDPGYHAPGHYVMAEYTQERAVKYILEKRPTFLPSTSATWTRLAIVTDGIPLNTMTALKRQTGVSVLSFRPLKMPASMMTQSSCSLPITADLTMVTANSKCCTLRRLSCSMVKISVKVMS